MQITMPQLIKQFPDGSTLEYDRGNFDQWCVYLTRPGVDRYAPKDFQYFERLIRYSQKYSTDTIYDDFVKLFNLTSRTLEQSTLDEIDKITAHYGKDSLEISIDFTIMYMGMIAEENKAFSRLGKRVKRLGVYQVLKEGMLPLEAANFSRGMKWRDIDRICNERGF